MEQSARRGASFFRGFAEARKYRAATDLSSKRSLCFNFNRRRCDLGSGVMAGVGASQRLFLSAVSRPAFHPPTSLRPSSRIRHFHHRCSNRTPRASPILGSTSWRAPRSSRPKSNSQLVSLGFIPSRREFSSSPIAHHGHLDPPKPGEEYVTHTQNTYSGRNLMFLGVP